MTKDAKIGLAAALLSFLFFLWLFLDAGGGTLALPLDDSYIYLQYARQAARGEWFSFSQGDPAGSGATSLLYMALLALFSALGYDGAWLAAVTTALAAACLGLTAVLLRRLARAFLPHCPTWTLGLLFLLCGPLLAGWFSGLEFALFATLLLAGFTNQALDGPAWKSTLWFSLLAFTRPEGQVASVLFAATALWKHRRSLPGLSAAGAQLGLAVLPTLVLVAVTGSAVPDSSRPKTAAAEGLGPTLDYLGGALRTLYLGLGTGADRLGIAGDAESGNAPVGHFPPFALLFAALGLGARVARLRRRFFEDAWAPLAAFSLVVLVLVAYKLPVGWNHHRYLLPTYPAMLLAMGLALEELHPRVRAYHPPSLKALYAVLVLFWLGFGLVFTARFVESSRDMARLYETRLGLPAEEAARLHPGARIAGADAGLVAWRSRAPVTDLIGVTDRAMAAHALLGKGAATDYLASRPPGLRPELAVIQDGRPDMDTRAWEKAGLLRRLKTFPQNGKAPTTGLYLWDFSPADRAALPLAHASLPESVRSTPNDSLNVALPGSETEHAWRGRGAPAGTVLGVLPGKPGGALVADGGRVIAGMEHFRMKAVPGRAGILVARLKAASLGRVSLRLDGVGEISAAALQPSNSFQQVSLPIPAGALVSGEPHVFIRCVDLEGQDLEYASYHYWLYQ